MPGFAPGCCSKSHGTAAIGRVFGSYRRYASFFQVVQDRADECPNTAVLYATLSKYAVIYTHGSSPPSAALLRCVWAMSYSTTSLPNFAYSRRSAEWFCHDLVKTSFLFQNWPINLFAIIFRLISELGRLRHDDGVLLTCNGFSGFTTTFSMRKRR